MSENFRSSASRNQSVQREWSPGLAEKPHALQAIFWRFAVLSASFPRSCSLFHPPFARLSRGAALPHLRPGLSSFRLTVPGGGSAAPWAGAVFLSPDCAGGRFSRTLGRGLLSFQASHSATDAKLGNDRSFGRKLLRSACQINSCFMVAKQELEHRAPPHRRGGENVT